MKIASGSIGSTRSADASNDMFTPSSDVPSLHEEKESVPALTCLQMMGLASHSQSQILRKWFAFFILDLLIPFFFFF